MPQSFQRSGKSYRCATIISAGQRIYLPCHNLFSGPANIIDVPQSIQRAAHPIATPQSFQRAGGYLFSGPEKTIAAPQSFQQAGKSHRRTTIFSAGRRIPLPCHSLFSGPVNPIAARHNHFSRPANPIATPQSFQRASESHYRVATFSAGQQIPLPRHKYFSRPANPITAPPALICCIKIYSKKPHYH